MIVLGAVQNDKVNISAGVTKDLIEKGLHAGKLVKQAAEVCGGGGGGRPDMAQAGGKQPEKLEEASFGFCRRLGEIRFIIRPCSVE